MAISRSNHGVAVIGAAIMRCNHGMAVMGAEKQSSGGDEPAKANHDQIADYLTDGFWEWAGGSRRAFDVAPGGTLTADITNLTVEAQQLARWALEAWTKVTGINFRFVESDADITFDDEEDGAYSSSVELGNQIISSFVNVSTAWLASYGSTIDSYSFSTYIHEIGHALGLGHAGPYNGFGDYGVDNIFPGDSWQATVMSYFSQTQNTYINATSAYAVTPMIADIIATQNLYGVPTDINAGDTVYGCQSNLDGYLGQFFALWTGESNDPEIYRDEAVTLTLYDTGGRDTLDLRTDTFDQRVDLRPEGASDVYGLMGNLVIARDTWIEDVIAGSGNDKVIGNAVANRLAGGAGNDELWGSGGDDVLEGGLDNDVLEGGAGADRLLGGAGMDTVSYSGSDEAVTVDLEASTVAGGHAEGDVIVDVENVLGSGYGDVLGGDDSANRLSGAGGNDRLSGRGGDDVLEGGAGADQLFGDTGKDELRGEDGDDVLEGGAGADQLDGGLGVDTVSYSGSDGAVTVDLEAGIGKRGHAEGDVIVDIENVLGSGYRDVLEGDSGSNRLSGIGGDDQLSGKGGDDVLEGGAGADRLDGGAGLDTVSYSGSDEAVTVDLEAGTVAGGHAEGDVIVDVENVLGSGYRDVLEGDSGGNRLSGIGGDDQLSGKGGDDVLEGGAGADQLDGGAGLDTVSYSGSDEAVMVDLEAGTGEGGHAEGDVIMDVENVLGSVHGDVLGGDDGGNRLDGGDGDDMLDGGAGADRLLGGAGMDTVSYSGSDEAVTVDLEADTREGGHAEGDAIVDVENVLGSGYGDVLGGDDGANRLSGGGGDDRLSGRGGDDVLEGGIGADRLLGGAGMDTVSYSGSDEAVTVDLKAGTGKGGHAEGDMIADVENVVGSGYGDVLGGDDGSNQLDGGDGDDMLDGGIGADRLYGGVGVDTVSYSGSDKAVTVYLWEGTGEGGHAEGDVIVDVENVVGSGYGDVLGGDARANRLDGGAGMDTVSYSGSDEAVTVDLEAGTGKRGHAEGDVIVNIENAMGSGYGDVLRGDGGANRLDGGDGDDILDGGAGADRLLGGAGVDTVSYAGSDRGVIVYLSEGTGKRGDAQGDVIVNFENVLGSVHGDVLGGDDGDNRLSGGGGNDRLLGAGGDDVLEGGAGADRLFGGAGVDTVSYAGSARGVIVYLSEGTGKRGDAQGDVIVSFENVLGSVHGDVLGGDDGGNWLSGGGGNDRLLGAGGDDMLEGGAGADRLFGGAGVDTVSYAGSDRGVIVYLSEGTGKRGDAEGDVIVSFENVLGSVHGDVLGGDDGANRLSGGGGNDRLLGGAGDDVLEGGAGADRLFGGAGVDTVSYAGSARGVIVYLSEGTGKRGHAEGDVIVQVESVVGSVHGDVLGGDDGANRLSGGGGNDRLSGRGGDDVLEGGAGADRLLGGGGDDMLEGGAGADRLLGGGGDDVLEGGAGADQLFGDTGKDELRGEDGDDVLEGGAGADRLLGGAGVDWVSYAGSDRGVTVNLEEGRGKRGHAEGDVITDIENVVGSDYEDVLEGDDNANRLSGGGGDDRLSGRGGDDVLEGGAGADRLLGGAGVDTVSYAGSDLGVTVNLGQGTVAGGHAEGDAITDIENVIGSEYDDFLAGDDGANRLDGGAGLDTVDYWDSDEAVTVDLEEGTGEGGHAEGDVITNIEVIIGSEYGDFLVGDDSINYLIGNAGNDELRGGSGDDWLQGDDGNDRLSGGGGGDWLQGNAGDDRLSGGSDNDVLEGGAGDDLLLGDDGDDLLLGDDGNDQLEGGGGDDTLWGGASDDRLSGGSGSDTLWGDDGADFLQGNDGNDKLLGGPGDDALWGNDGDDELRGNAGDDELRGGADDDNLWGDDGNDRLSGGSGNDGLQGGDGDDTLWGGASDDLLLGDAGADFLQGDAGNDRLWGNDGDDELWGGDGNDFLDGNAGDDELRGGAGDDDLWGGAGDDVFRFNFDHGDDIIADFTDGEDLIDLSVFVTGDDLLDPTGFDALSGFDELVVSSDSGGVTIDLTAHLGGTIRLKGFDIADLDAGDFLFA